MKKRLVVLSIVLFIFLLVLLVIKFILPGKGGFSLPFGFLSLSNKMPSASVPAVPFDSQSSSKEPQKQGVPSSSSPIPVSSSLTSVTEKPSQPGPSTFYYTNKDNKDNKDEVLALVESVTKAGLEEKLQGHKAKIAEHNAKIDMIKKNPNKALGVAVSGGTDYPNVPPPNPGFQMSRDVSKGFARMVSLSPEKEAYVELEDGLVVVVQEGDTLRGSKVVSIDKNGVTLEGGNFLPLGAVVSKKQSDKRSGAERSFSPEGPRSPASNPISSSGSKGVSQDGRGN